MRLSVSAGRDIVRLASETHAAWILLGFHRPVLGANFRGGTVREILEAVDDLPISVGVVVNAYEQPLATIAVVTDNSVHGWASLDLATRIAHQQECELRLLWIEAPSTQSDAELQEMLGVASARVARVSTAPMAAPTADELETHLQCPLVVIGGELADRLGIANHLTNQKRCTIVVYGASVLVPAATRAVTAGAEGSIVARQAAYRMKIMAASLLFEDNSLFRHINPLFAFHNSLFLRVEHFEKSTEQMKLIRMQSGSRRSKHHRHFASFP